MRQKQDVTAASAEKTIRDIRRATRRHRSAEEKIRIVLSGLRGEDSISELCRREGIAESLYYSWSKEFLEAGSYGHRAEGCPFCNIEASRIIAEDALCLAVRDGFPVTEGHTLVIPKRHTPHYFELYEPELFSVNRLLQKSREALIHSDPSIEGFNIGANAGESAGQTVMHCHVHLIPRRRGDSKAPRGGVRGVIPDKQSY